MDRYTRNDKIWKLYFVKKMTCSEIAKEIDISISQISRIVRKNENYMCEKKRRKEESEKRHREGKRKSKMKKRNSQINEKASMDYLHNQASRILSGRRTINNRAFRKCNSSIYEYYEKTSEYRIKEDFKGKVSYAAPRKIKWK